jgi:hypothetical protein
VPLIFEAHTTTFSKTGNDPSPYLHRHPCLAHTARGAGGGDSGGGGGGGSNIHVVPKHTSRCGISNARKMEEETDENTKKFAEVDDVV